MKRLLVIERFLQEVRTALMEDGKPIELRLLDLSEAEQVGAVYLARVLMRKPELHAAFVDIGGSREAFLEDAPEDLRAGDYALVQGKLRPPAGSGKAFRVTPKVQLTGQFVVFRAGKGQIGCSSKIRDAEERQRLIALARACIQEGEGIILRTSAANGGEDEIRAEIEALRKRWEALRTRADMERKPGILYERSYIDRIASKYASQMPGEIVTNDRESIDGLLRMMQMHVLPTKTVLRFHDESDSGLLCDAYGLDEAFLKAQNRKIWLPGGGFLIVDVCEALTVYDVNSGKSVGGKGKEAACLALDLEAVRAVAEHLRLCDIGGIAVADLVDLAAQEDREAVVREFKRCCAEDSAQIDEVHISKLGLLELTRRRDGPSLLQQMFEPCMVCAGRGTVPSARRFAIGKLREIRRAELSGKAPEHVLLCSTQEAREIAELAGCEYIVCAEPSSHGRKTLRLTARARPTETG